MNEDQNKDSKRNTEVLLREQLGVMKKQLRMSRITAGIIGIAAAALIASAAIVTPQAFQAFRRANALLEELDSTSLTEMIQSIDGLAKSSQEDMGQAMDKLNQLDLDGLNRAIQNLENTTRPLAELFGRSN